jgi:tetratricopeptide (TPR) repeat protein
MRTDYPIFPTRLAPAVLRSFAESRGAEEHLRRHLKLNPNSIQGWFQLGLAHLARQRNVEATEAFGRAVGLKPDFGPAWFNLGWRWGAMGVARRRCTPFARPAPQPNTSRRTSCTRISTCRWTEGPAVGLLDQAAN